MDYSVFDLEGDGLTPTKIYCLSIKRFRNGVEERKTLTNYTAMREFFAEERVLVGHNIILFDIPVIERILGIRYTGRLIDTLALSWYLYPTRTEHGLESWGEEVGVRKVEITDWHSLKLEDYIHRCEEDVRINTIIFNQFINYLNILYGREYKDNIIGYLMYKMDCAREQVDVRWKLDVEKCKQNLIELYAEKEKRVAELFKVMPKVAVYKMVNKPAACTKKDGDLSVSGTKWFTLLAQLELPDDYEEPIKVVAKYKDPNPTSHQQIKAWLYSLGWVPLTWEYKRDKKTEQEKKTEKVSTKDGDICPSVEALFEKEPALVHLEGLFAVSHRIGLLNGFLENKSEDNYLKAEIAGFTNTLRFKHKTIVNLPTIFKKYGKYARECLIASEGEVLCGSDVSSLEDQAKRHYMYDHDPEYVKEMMHPDFDSHLDIALEGELITKEEEAFFKWYNKTKEENKNNPDFKFKPEEDAEFKRLSKIRKDGKQANFSSTYGAGARKISLSSNMKIEMATLLHTAYWKRNWAIKRIAELCIVKTIGEQMWLWNPVSRFWYSLRYEKDRFSTLNQGTGVYCFDTWVRKVRRKGYRLCGQFHDEIVTRLFIGNGNRMELEDKTRNDLRQAMVEANDELQLNIKLSISVDFGHSYADVH